jgi:hypothetical protein
MRALTAFRVIVTAHCALILVQAGLAGRYLSGGFDSISIHSANAGLLFLLGVTQLVTAGVLWRRGRGPAWPVGASALVLFAEVLQIGAGYSQNLGLHVPLGVTLFGVTAALTGWAWSARSGAVAPRASRA